MSLAANELGAGTLPPRDEPPEASPTGPASERRRRSRRDDAPPVGAVLGRLTGLGNSGEPLVDFPENPSDHPLPARSVVAIESGAIGGEVVLHFERGSLQKPIVMGLLRPPAPAPADVEIDGERIVLAAEKEIVLRCGEASITLTRAGKVLIRGAYLLSRSAGVNRIKGGSVQIN